MAQQQATLVLRVVTYHPGKNEDLGIPAAKLEIKDNSPLNLKFEDQVADAQGYITLQFSYDDSKGNAIHPQFEIEVPEASRSLLAAETGTAEPLSLPGSWTTGHGKRGASVSLDAHPDQNTALPLYVGLPVIFSLSYTDFHPSGIRNPTALPAQTLAVRVYDEDITGCMRWLNPEDYMFGKAVDGDGKLLDLAEGSPHPLNDDEPIVPHHKTEDAPDSAAVPIYSPGSPTAHFGSAGFDQVRDLAIDRRGFVFVADFGDTLRFAPDGTLLETIDTGVIRSFALDKQNSLFALSQAMSFSEILLFRFDEHNVDLNRNPMHSYRSKGDFFDWERPGDVNPNDPLSGIGGLNRSGRIHNGGAIARLPSSIGKDRLVVTDRGKADGGSTTEIGFHVFSIRYGYSSLSLDHKLTVIPADGTFAEPRGVVADKKGRIYIADEAKHQVTVWQWDPSTPAATLQATWGKPDATPGNGAGEFSEPSQLALDEKTETLLVLEKGNNRIQRIDTRNGASVSLWQPGTVTALTVDERGEIFLSLDNPTPADRVVQRFTMYQQNNGQAIPLGGEPATYGAPIRQRDHASRLKKPTYLAWGNDGSLWVSDTDRDLLWTLKRNAENRAWEVVSPPNDQFRAPVGLAFDDLHIYVSESGQGRIEKFLLENMQRVGTGLGDPGSGEGELADPMGLCLCNHEGNTRLLVAEKGNHRVQVLDTDGNHVAFLKGPESSFKNPEDVAVTSDGQVFVACSGIASGADAVRGRIFKGSLADPSTTLAELEITFPGIVNLDIQRPCGVFVDGQNAVLVTDREAHLVLRMDPDGQVSDFWDMENFVDQSLMRVHPATSSGTVTIDNPNHLEAAADRYGKATWLVKSPIVLTLNSSTGTDTFNVPRGSLVHVANNSKVVERVELYSEPKQTINIPELATMQVWNAPNRAIIDKEGLLAVADTGHHRVSLLRTAAHTRVNVVNRGLGPFESFPDIMYSLKAEGHWLTDLGITGLANENIGAGGATLSREAESTAETENFAHDRFERRFNFQGNDLFRETVQALRVMRKVQQWMVDLTREGNGETSWFERSKQRALRADLDRSTENSHHHWMRDGINLGSDTTGRGDDVWDDRVIAHEMGHWIFDISAGFPRTNAMRAHGGSSHQIDQRINPVHTVIEGFAEYIEAFTLGSSAKRDVGYQVGSVRFHPPGDPHGWDYMDLYDQPELGLEVEGYFANALYFLHQLLMGPILFADHPAFWHRDNFQVSTEASQRYVAVFRQAILMLPENPSQDLVLETARRFLISLRTNVAAHAPDWLNTWNAILEFNNLILPKITVFEADAGFNPGSAVSGNVSAAVGDTVRFVVKVELPEARPAAGYRIGVGIGEGTTPPDGITLTGTESNYIRGGHMGQHAARITGSEGTVNLSYSPPAPTAGTEVSLVVRYRPNFLSDRGFAPPERNDDLPTCMGKLLMQRLKPEFNFSGATVKNSITITVNP